jgi:DNA primase
METAMQNWVDFAAIKRSIALAPLLRHYQVKLHRSGRDQYRGCCPIHGGDGREAFHANLAKNVFHCFACGAGGTVLDFVVAMDRCSLQEAAWKLTSQTATLNQPARACTKPLVTKKLMPLSPLGFSLSGIDSTHPYLAARSIDTATAEEFGIGFYSGPGIFSRRLVIPIHSERAELVAYCGRAVDGSQPRYRFPAGFAKSQVLFNFHRADAAAKSVVVVVEGFFDCMRLRQAGVRSVVALMGSALYPPQQRILLQRFQRVILMLDRDAAGRRATAEVAARLRAHCLVQVADVAESIQPDQMAPEQIRQILNACRSADSIGQVQ